MALLTDRAGDVWIGTRQSGLDRLDRRSGSFRHYPPTGDSSGPSAAGVVGLLEDADGSLWIATFGGGLDRLDPERGVFTSHRHDPDDPTSLAADRIHDLILDDEGRLWIATKSAGLDLYDRSTGRFRHLRHDPSDAGSLPSDALQVLQIGDDGALWIGTEGAGLVLMEHYDPRTGAADFRQWTEQDGLADNTIFGLQRDDQGAMWLSSHAGLTRFDPVTETSHHFTARHGLQGNEFTFGAHGRGVDGELFFGGLKGFNAFAPSQIDFSAEPPAVVLTGLELGNRPAADTAPELIDSLSLDHMQRSVAFEFAALDFIAPDEVRYAYRLVPFDDDWIETPRRRATYTNLDAGDYVFTVRATNADGNTSTEGLSIQVKVAAAPWNTWWARTAYLLFTLALLYLGVRWRLAGLERRSTELEALVATRTIELSDTVEQLRASEAEAVEARRRALRSLEEALQERRRAQAASQAKSQFLSSMSHELRTPLNAVLGFAQLMERDTDLAPGHRESLHTILRSGEHLLGLINDVLSLSKIEAGKLLLSEEPFDLRRTVADLDAMLRVRAETDGLALHMEVAPGVPAAVFGDGGRLAQILLNLLGNAVKFTDDGQVSLRVGYEATEAVFEVEDSGCGIAAEEIDRLFEPFAQTPGGHAAGGTGLGLPISQELVRLMGGELSVESELGVGSRFRF
ncbi:MAG: ATP-binding protein, partial [Acidobacteriota bacterium]